MRISTNMIFQQGLSNMLNQQSELLKTQDQVSSGKKNKLPSDDPSAASRVLDLNESIAQLKQFGRNADFATQRLNLEEVALSSSVDALQRVRELAVQAANTGVQDVQSNHAIAAELRQKLSELMDYANTKDAGGDYLFSGFQSKTAPFSQDAFGNFSYNGDQGQLQQQLSGSRQVATSDSGATIFQRIRMGNGDFSVDAHNANSGTGVITAGSIVNPAAYKAEDFVIQFTAADTYNVLNATTGAVVQTAQPFIADSSLLFNGVSVDISGTPDAGDSFTVQASRNQDVFTGLQGLINALESPVSGNVRGSVGGDYINSGFDAGDTVSFDIEYDGVTIPINYTVAAGDTNINIATEIFSQATPTAPNTSLKSFADANASLTDNADGTFTLQGNTAGLSLTFELGGPSGTDIVFRSDGGNADRSSNLRILNLADDNASLTGNNASLSTAATGTSSTASNSITAGAATPEIGVIASGVLSNSVISQQIGSALGNFDQAIGSIINVQTQIGGRINSIESQQVDNDSRDVQLKSVRSNIEDIDLAEAISRLTFQTTALQAAQQTFVRIQNLNLFSLL